MRLTLRCMIHAVPVELLIEGEGLEPYRACEIPGSCLSEVDTMLAKITVKNLNGEGGQPGMPNRPGTSTASQTPQLPEATP